MARPDGGRANGRTRDGATEPPAAGSPHRSPRCAGSAVAEAPPRPAPYGAVPPASNLLGSGAVLPGAMTMPAYQPPPTPPTLLPAAAPAARPDGDVALAAGGDRRAFERIYRAHVGRVFALCVRMVGDPGAAEELTQDVFVLAWDKLALYRENVDRIYALCMRMSGDPAGAEELTQDVFVRAWEKLDSFRGDSAFSTWLHRLAVNVVLNHRKSEGRRRGREDDDQTVLDEQPGVQAPAGMRLDLEQAIAGLPPGARRVFILHDVEGFKHEEIAGLLGITSGGSKAQLHRARMLLREALDR